MKLPHDQQRILADLQRMAQNQREYRYIRNQHEAYPWLSKSEWHMNPCGYTYYRDFYGREESA